MFRFTTATMTAALLASAVAAPAMAETWRTWAIHPEGYPNVVALESFAEDVALEAAVVKVINERPAGGEARARRHCNQRPAWLDAHLLRRRHLFLRAHVPQTTSRSWCEKNPGRRVGMRMLFSSAAHRLSR